MNYPLPVGSAPAYPYQSPIPAIRPISPSRRPRSPGYYYAPVYSSPIPTIRPISPSRRLQSPRRHYTEVIRTDSGLTEQQAKYCSCLADVAAKQPEGCLETEAWYEHIDGKVCTNPYAVCAKTVGTTVRHCADAYSRPGLTPEQERGLLELHHKQTWNEFAGK